MIGHWPVVVCLLCLVALTPLLRTDAPCTHDGPLHYFRVVAMRHALKDGAPSEWRLCRGDGMLFSRYLPDLAFGYGYPFFNYRAPVSYYLALALYLAGMGLPVALNLVYVLGIAGSALGAYLLARDLFGPQAGFVAAVAYAYAPYQFLDALQRANAPESLAMALLPLILWAFRRLLLTGRRRWFVASVTSLALLYLTHNISSLLFTPFLLAYLAVLWWVHRQETHWAMALAALALGLGLAAFFWAPALLEKDYVQLYRSYSTRNNNFHYNFISLAEVFAPPAAADTALMNPPIDVHLGLVQTILAGIGLVAGLIRARQRGRRAGSGIDTRIHIFLALSTVLMIWMSTRASLWFWEHVPLLPFVQFPWRFVGRAALPVALLAGAAVPGDADFTHGATRATSRISRVLPLVVVASLVALLILSALPATYPPYGYCAADAHPTIGDVFAYERESGLVGVDPEGSYFPVWTKSLPEGSPLEQQYARGQPIARFDESALPEGASAIEAGYGPNQARVVLQSPFSFQARYLAFYFPGWHVTVDGEPIPTTPSEPEGLITFEVPAGKHTITVRFGSTPIRTAFALLSSLSLVVFATLGWRLEGGAWRAEKEKRARMPAVQGVGRAEGRWVLLILGLLLLAFKLGVVDRTETLFRRSALRPDGSLSSAQQPLQVDFGGQLALIGYDLPSSPVLGVPRRAFVLRADEMLEVILYWRAVRPLDGDHIISLQLVDDEGQRYGQVDAGHDSSGWQTDSYARDVQEMDIWPGTPPGEYTLLAGVYDVRTGQSLDVRDASGVPVGTTYSLASVQVTRPSHSPDPDRLDVARTAQTDLGGGLRLLGLDPPPTEANAGDLLPLTLFWQATDAPAGDYSVHLFLAAHDGTEVTQAPGLPFSNIQPPTLYPTSAWLPGDVFRDGHRFLVPAATPDGTYSLRMELLDPSGLPLAPAASLIDVRVHAPERTFDSPAAQYPLSATLDGQATLLGYDLSDTRLAPGQTFTLTLHWRAEASAPDAADVDRGASGSMPAAGLVVFAHFLDPTQRIQAQSDRVPVAGSRPTTGWLPGEVLRDEHTLTLAPDASPGEYVLEVGMYDPASGERLPALDRDGTRVSDRILLPTPIQVE